MRNLGEKSDSFFYFIIVIDIVCDQHNKELKENFL